MSRKIFKRSGGRVDSAPFQFQAPEFSDSPIDLEAEAELDAFDEGISHGSLGGGGAFGQHSSPRGQHVDMGELIERAQQDAQAIIADAKQHAAAIEREAYEKGLEEGRKTGEIMAEQQLQAILTQYHHSLTALDQLRELIISQNQLELMELIVHTAQKVIQTELTMTPQTILPMIKGALQSLKQRKEIVIYLNADDHHFVYGMAEAERQKWIGTQSQIEIDASLGRGSFRIETIAGELDASIEAQLQQLQQNLAEAVASL